jgi:subtilase family serine protease
MAQPEFDSGAMQESTYTGRLMLILRRSPQQEADLDSFLRSLQDLSSSSFHAYLTLEQFGVRFGPSEADVALVENWLKSRGFRILRHRRSIANRLPHGDSCVQCAWRQALR